MIEESAANVPASIPEKSLVVGAPPLGDAFISRGFSRIQPLKDPKAGTIRDARPETGN